MTPDAFGSSGEITRTFREGEAPAEPGFVSELRLGGSLALPGSRNAGQPCSGELSSDIPMTLRLLDDLQNHARTRPQALAVLSVNGREQRLAYADLQHRVTSLAGVVRARLPLGSTIVICGPNRPSYIADFLGILAAGSTVFPLAADLTESELASAARRSKAAAAIIARPAADSLRSHFHNATPLDPADSTELLSAPTWDSEISQGPALLLQSSGTTAEPKIARRDGPSLDTVSRAMVQACHFGPDDHVLAAVPLCHSYGLEHGLLAPITAGSCVHVCEKFDLAPVLAQLRYGGITMLPGVPFMFDMLARAQGASFPALRRAYSAGGPLPVSTYDAFLGRFGLRIGQVYGATEIGSVTFNDPDSPLFAPAAVGAAMEGVDIRILSTSEPRIDHPLPVGEEGHVAILARSMMSGYIDMTSSPLLGGYYLTGDLGRLDAQGVLTLTGRLKLLIDVGGRKVNPAEVEAVLRQHPGVESCVVIPIRVTETISRVKAIVTRRDGAAGLSADELRAFARQHLSAHKVPRVIEFRDALPVSASGKVIRSQVENA
jgi:acyl-CoA synthetase (AMP-forming)/AMP-acid ligase II